MFFGAANKWIGAHGDNWITGALLAVAVIAMVLALSRSRWAKAGALTWLLLP